MKKINVIAYDTPHRKTQDVLFGLKARGYENVCVHSIKFVERENNFKPLIKHRPDYLYDVFTRQLARRLGYEYKEGSNRTEDLFLIAGCGILPSHFVEKNTVINSHPAYLPFCRGLDALKWAIWYGHPVGVTTHKACSEADSGELVKQEFINPNSNDSFYSFAMRQYALEIKLLLDSIEDLEEDKPKVILEVRGELNRRMPHRIERYLEQRFEELKLNCMKNLGK